VTAAIIFAIPHDEIATPPSKAGGKCLSSMKKFSRKFIWGERHFYSAPYKKGEVRITLPPLLAYLLVIAYMSPQRDVWLVALPRWLHPNFCGAISIHLRRMNRVG